MKTLADGIRVTDAVLTQIVVRAAESVGGVRVKRPKRHLEVEVTAGEARVSLDLTVDHGTVIPDAARAVQDRVAGALGTMLDVRVRNVDINVEGVG